MKFMKDIPDNFYQWGVVDPNYGLNADKPSKKPNKAKQKNGAILDVKSPIYKHKDWDSKPAGPEYFKELLRVTQNQIIWGVNYYDFNFPSGGRLVWDKINGDSDQFDCEIAYVSSNNRTDLVRYMWAGMFQGIKICKNFLLANEQKGDKSKNELRIHPTQKPVALYRYTLNKYCNPGDKILDTHGGSMSNAIACDMEGFDLDICEIDKEIFYEGVARFNEYKSIGILKFE